MKPGGLLAGGWGPQKPPPPLRPFNADESVQNPDGSMSTERTVTIQTPDGWVNIPSLWKGPNGVVDVMTMPEPEARLQWLLRQLEVNGPMFKRHRSVEEAEAEARRRSDAGGAKSGRSR